MRRVPMTAVGEKQLRDELHVLKTVDRPRIVQAIAEAREHGDLKENAEYHAAREQQSFAEGRIKEIEGKLADSEVINITQIPVSDRVVFGATVKLININTDEEFTYQIVGEDEADIKKGKISYTSPLSRALIGKEIQEVVVVNTPGGEVEYEIDEVLHL